MEPRQFLDQVRFAREIRTVGRRNHFDTPALRVSTGFQSQGLQNFSGLLAVHADAEHAFDALLAKQDGWHFQPTRITVRQPFYRPAPCKLTQKINGAIQRGHRPFRIDAAGSFTRLHSFDVDEGASPQGGLTRGSDGYLYGAMGAGGTVGYGSLFRMTDAGAVSMLHDFEGPDGAKIFVDKKSLLFLNGTVLEYDTSLVSRGFVFNNPNAKSTCGCGSSFGA